MIQYLKTVLNNKCPRCREGKLFISNNAYNFEHNLSMNEYCPVCNQRTEIEVGFYYGTGYVSYALSVAFLVSAYVASVILFNVSITNNSIFWWLAITCFLLLAIQPPMMRLSRSLWLSWFVKYEKNWKEKLI
jgi:uncharacterized protein (DUF983 family)